MCLCRATAAQREWARHHWTAGLAHDRWQSHGGGFGWTVTSLSEESLVSVGVQPVLVLRDHTLEGDLIVHRLESVGVTKLQLGLVKAMVPLTDQP